MQQATINSPDEAKAIISAEINRTDETRLQHRLHCILLICDGKTCADVSTLFGDSKRAIQYWVKHFNEKGVDGLRDAGKPGRAPRLSEENKKALKEDLCRSPREFGYSHNLWDGKLMSHHLKEKFHIELKVRQCQNMFHQLGFRRRKPRPLIAKSDPEAQQEYKKT